jgi:starch phosphorylase
MGLGMFSSLRMVENYRDMFYVPAMENYKNLSQANGKPAANLVEQKQRLLANFPHMNIEVPQIEGDLKGEIHVGDSFKVRVKVFLNELKPEEVDIQIYTGSVNVHNEIITSAAISMHLAEDLGSGHYIYEHIAVCRNSGRFGITARIVPIGDSWKNSMPGFICWPQ